MINQLALNGIQREKILQQ